MLFVFWGAAVIAHEAYVVVVFKNVIDVLDGWRSKPFFFPFCAAARACVRFFDAWLLFILSSGLFCCLVFVIMRVGGFPWNPCCF